MDISPFVDRANAIVGMIAAIGTYAFGQHWWLFLAYLLLNLADLVTGWMKSKLSGRLSSARGFKGILKKFGYWIIIAMSFGLGAIFIETGEIIGIDLGITVVLGWFALIALIINEFRSILENFVEMGYSVPKFLIGGLEVAQDKIEAVADEILHTEHEKEVKDDENEQ